MVGGGAEIRVIFYSQEETILGGVRVNFTDPPQYWVGWCTTEWIEFTLPQLQQERIWTITKMNSSVSINCDGNEIVNYEFPADTQCKDKWSGDVVKMQFWDDDTASDEYRAFTLNKTGSDNDGIVEAGIKFRKLSYIYINNFRVFVCLSVCLSSV